MRERARWVVAPKAARNGRVVFGKLHLETSPCVVGLKSKASIFFLRPVRGGGISAADLGAKPCTKCLAHVRKEIKQ